MLQGFGHHRIVHIARKRHVIIRHGLRRRGCVAHTLCVTVHRIFFVHVRGGCRGHGPRWWWPHRLFVACPLHALNITRVLCQPGAKVSLSVHGNVCRPMTEHADQRRKRNGLGLGQTFQDVRCVQQRHTLSYAQHLCHSTVLTPHKECIRTAAAQRRSQTATCGIAQQYRDNRFEFGRQNRRGVRELASLVEGFHVQFALHFCFSRCLEPWRIVNGPWAPNQGRKNMYNMMIIPVPSNRDLVGFGNRCEGEETKMKLRIFIPIFLEDRTQDRIGMAARTSKSSRTTIHAGIHSEIQRRRQQPHMRFGGAYFRVLVDGVSSIRISRVQLTAILRNECTRRNRRVSKETMHGRTAECFGSRPDLLGLGRKSLKMMNIVEEIANHLVRDGTHMHTRANVLQVFARHVDRHTVLAYRCKSMTSILRVALRRCANIAMYVLRIPKRSKIKTVFIHPCLQARCMLPRQHIFRQTLNGLWIPYMIGFNVSVFHVPRFPQVCMVIVIPMLRTRDRTMGLAPIQATSGFFATSRLAPSMPRC